MVDAAARGDRAIPGPSGPEMLANLRLMRRRPPDFLAQCARRYGPVVRFPIPRSDVFFISDPVDVRRVLQGNHTAYGKRTVQYDTLSRVAGSGLLSSDADVWRRMRRIVSPAFHRHLVSGMAETVVRVTDDWGSQAFRDADVDLDLDAAMLELSLQLVAGTLFNTPIDDAKWVAAAVSHALGTVVARAQQPLRVPESLRPPQRTLDAALQVIDEEVVQLLRKRRAHPAGDDVLSLLIQAMDEQIASEREVRDEVVTLIVAGHETVAATLTWTWLLLAANPDIEQRLHQEVDGLAAIETWDADTLGQLPYTRAVVDECLRLYPPAWVVTRRSLEPDLIGGCEIPGGATVIMSPYVTHRDSRWWPDPLRFDPRRFQQREASEAGGGSLTYFPFGAGPRLCIGRDLALLEAPLVVAALARSQRFRPHRPASIALDFGVTLRPKGNVTMSASRRQRP